MGLLFHENAIRCDIGNFLKGLFLIFFCLTAGKFWESERKLGVLNNLNVWFGSEVGFWFHEKLK